MNRSIEIEHALSWAHQNGYSMAHNAIRAYLQQTGARAFVATANYVEFKDRGQDAPRFMQEINL